MPAINLSIVSTVTYVKSTGTIVGYDPQIQVLRDLEGNVYPPKDVAVRALSVTTLNPYSFEYRTTSSNQPISLFNFGNSALTVTSITFTTNGVEPVLDVPGEIISTKGWTINAGESVQFSLKYYSTTPGTYNNSFTILSNDNLGGTLYTVPTVQTVTKQDVFYISPTNLTSATSIYGDVISKRFYIHTAEISDTLLDFTPAIIGFSQGFSVEKVSSDSFDLIFKANQVANVNGTYTAKVSVLATVEDQYLTTSTQSKEITGSVELNIDFALYEHYSSWISAGAPHNSIIGISYDKINGQKYLTIGIGAGADNTPDYDSGGAEYLSLPSLGVDNDVLDIPFPYWNQVYRIPIGDSAGSWLSGDYAIKTTSVNWGSYFGEYSTSGSMFIVENDGYNNIKITMNVLRTLSGDEYTDVTLVNLSKAFYYYSETDIGGRITQLGYPIGDGTQTLLFTGFDSLGVVTTEIIGFESS